MLLGLQTQRQRQHIRIAPRTHQVMEQHPFLQRRQRIDVLDVARPAGHALRDRIDLFLRKLHQRQHLRVMRVQPAGIRFGAACSSSPSRCLEALRQILQPRPLEYLPRTARPSRFPHSLQQLHDQQRVAPKLEEVVLPPHLLYLQQLAPDPRQRLLGAVQSGG